MRPRKVPGGQLGREEKIMSLLTFTSGFKAYLDWTLWGTLVYGLNYIYSKFQRMET